MSMASDSTLEGLVAAPTVRFSGRAGDYAAHRPDYPEALVGLLEQLAAELGLSGGLAGRTVADLGAGTGLCVDRVVATGAKVIAIEPNDAMRAQAEARFAGDARVEVRRGDAESTGLADDSVDLVFSAQAFHWFDPIEARREARRIGRAPVPAMVIWNLRRLAGNAFLEDYEAFCIRWGRDYAQVRDRWGEPRALARFFGGDGTPRAPAERRLEHHQWLDREGFRGRTASSSFLPRADEPRGEEMYAELDRLFDRHADATGRVRFDYDVCVYYGCLD